MNIADKQAVIKAVFLLTVYYEMEPTSDEKGILPNSKIIKNLINFGSTYNITDKLACYHLAIFAIIIWTMIFLHTCTALN